MNMHSAIRSLTNAECWVSCVHLRKVLSFSIFDCSRPPRDAHDPSRGTRQNPKNINIDGLWDGVTGPEGVEGGAGDEITPLSLTRAKPRQTAANRAKIKNGKPPSAVFHIPYSIFHFFALALLLCGAPHTFAEQFFKYDKADQIVTTTTLENPLFYDASVLKGSDDRAASSDTLVAWLEFQPSKRDIVWFGIRNGTTWLQKTQITTESADCANPTLTRDNSGRLWLTYESTANGVWAVFATVRNADGTFTKPTRLSWSLGPSINHRTAPASDGGIWIVWQGDNHGQFDIFALHPHDLNPTGLPLFTVGQSPLGDWHPTVTALTNGYVYVAWDSYDGIAYNIRTRQFHNGTWGKVMDVTASKNFNANPSITSDKQGRVWLAWEEDGPNWGKAYQVRTDAKKESQKMSDDIGSVHRFRKLHLAEVINDNSAIREYVIPQPSFKLAENRTNAPAGIKKLGVFYQSSELTTDNQDRLWLVYRHFYMPLMGITGMTHVQNDWAIYARCFENGVWSKLFRFDKGQGDALQRIAVSPSTDGIEVAYTFGRTDRRNPQNYEEDALAPDKVVPHVSKKRVPSSVEEGDDGVPLKSKPWMAKTQNQSQQDGQSLTSGRGVAIGGISLQQANTMQYSYSAGQPKTTTLRVESAASPKPARPVIDFNGTHYELYYGDFHRHTDISLCFWPGDGTMDDAYRYGIDAAPLDFLGVTDHTHDIAMGDPLSLMWQRIRKEVNRHALTNTFIPFYSYERSRGDTDHNVISLRDDMLRPHTYPHSEFWKELDTNTFTIPHQPFNSVLWKTNDREHRPLMEIYQGFRGHTCEADATNGLAHDNEVGFIASSDHLSTGLSFACVWAEQPTRESIFTALKARRTFAAMDKTILRVTCGDHWMGEKFEVAETPVIKIFAKPAAGEITKLEAYVDGIAHRLPLTAMDTDHYEYVPDPSLKGKHTIFFRVTESNGHFAWSSPMWITVR